MCFRLRAFLGADSFLLLHRDGIFPNQGSVYPNGGAVHLNGGDF